MRRMTQSPIPPNLGGGELWGGIFKIRNAVESAIIFVVFYFLHMLIEPFFPGSKVLLIIFILIALPIMGIALVGVNGEPLSVFIMNVINYSNSRTFVTLRPPMPMTDEEGEGKSDSKGDFLDKALNSLFTNIKGGNKK